MSDWVECPVCGLWYLPSDPLHLKCECEWYKAELKRKAIEEEARKKAASEYIECNRCVVWYSPSDPLHLKCECEANLAKQDKLRRIRQRTQILIDQILTNTDYSWEYFKNPLNGDQLLDKYLE